MGNDAAYVAVSGPYQNQTASRWMCSGAPFDVVMDSLKRTMSVCAIDDYDERQLKSSRSPNSDIARVKGSVTSLEDRPK